MSNETNKLGVHFCKKDKIITVSFVSESQKNVLEE